MTTASKIIVDVQKNEVRQETYEHSVDIERAKSGLHIKNRQLCEKAITEVYDIYAQRNIQGGRKNLDTGENYTEQDLINMNVFIDSKRELYKQYKDSINSVSTEEELNSIRLNYSN